MRILLVAALVLLAGCATPEAPSAPPSDAVVPAPIESLLACYDYRVAGPAEEASVPEGFTPVEFAPGQPMLATLTYACDVDGGADAEEHLEGIAVEPPAPLALEGATHVVLRQVVAAQPERAALFGQRGIAALAGSVEPGYNMRGPAQHQGGYAASAEGFARGFYMRGNPATIAAGSPIRFFAFDEDNLTAILDYVPATGCQWSGAGYFHDGDALLPMSEPASARAASGLHDEKAAFAVRAFRPGDEPPALPEVEGLAASSDPLSACAG